MSVENIAYFKDVRKIHLSEFGRASSKAVFFDKESVQKLSFTFSEDDSDIVQDFLLSGIVKPEDNLQDLVDSINKDTPIVVVEARSNPVKRGLNCVLKGFGISPIFTMKYNWCVVYRDIMAIRVFKEIESILNENKALKGIDDLNIYVAVIKRKELTFDNLRKSKNSYLSVVSDKEFEAIN